jgi:hypothetical protein
MASSGILRCVALVRTAVSEELSSFFIMMTRIGELGTTLALTSNRGTLNITIQFCVPWGGGGADPIPACKEVSCPMESVSIGLLHLDAE